MTHYDMKGILAITLILASVGSSPSQETIHFFAGICATNDVPLGENPDLFSCDFTLSGSNLTYTVSQERDQGEGGTSVVPGIYGPAEPGQTGDLIFGLTGVPSGSPGLGPCSIPFEIYGASLTLTPRQIADLKSGLWYVDLGLNHGQITVTNPPVSIIGPQGGSYNGQVASGYTLQTPAISAYAWGTEPLSYLWVKNGVQIYEGTCFEPIELSDAGAYQIIVSNAFGSVTGGVFALSMNASTPSAVTYTVTAHASPTNGGLVAGDGPYNAGSRVALQATPNPNYKFVSWTIAKNVLWGWGFPEVVNEVVGTNIVYTSVVKSNETFTAHFALVNEQITTLSAPPRAGSTSGGGSMAYGSKATVKARPASGYLFSSWTLNGTALSLSSSYKFTVFTNETLTANFVTNVFLAAQGTYEGLFAPTNAPRQQTNSGAITLSVTSSGVLSGKLTFGAKTSSLTGQFDPAGADTIITSRKGESSLITTLQMDFAGQAVSGSVTDGSFVAQLVADRDVFSATYKATNYKGPYTFIIAGTDNPALGPFGTSYGTVTVSALGAVSFTVNLADGTKAPVNPTSVVSKDGYWPFYLPLYSGNGSLWSWNCFTNGAIISAPNASWLNGTNSAKTALYRAGFTNETVSIFGSAYDPTNKPLLALSKGEVTLEGGNLPFTLTNQITLASNNLITLTNAADTNKLKLTINKTNGVISGTFANPSNPKQTITVNGVLLQNQTNAAGFFPGTNQTGSFLLH